MRLHSTLALALATTVGMAAAVQADMIGFYEFEGNYNDSSGLGNDGTAEGDTAIAPFSGVDGIGSAAQFSGQGHVVVPINSNPSVYPDMSVTMWVKADASIVGTPGLYKTFGHDDGGWDRTFGLDNREGDYRWAAFTGGAGPGPTPATDTPVTDEWTFLAAVWNSDDPEAGFNSITFYTGGPTGPLASIKRPLTNTPSGHTTSAIGNLRPDNFAEGFVGLIDNVTIHDAALNQGEVTAWRALTVPEPATACLLGIGLASLGVMRRRR